MIRTAEKSVIVILINQRQPDIKVLAGDPTATLPFILLNSPTVPANEGLPR